MKQNKKTINEAQLGVIVSKAVKNVLTEVIYDTYGKEWTFETAKQKLKEEITSYFDCPTIGAYKDVMVAMRWIVKKFPQIHLYEEVNQIIKDYFEEIDYQRDEILKLVSTIQDN